MTAAMQKRPLATATTLAIAIVGRDGVLTGRADQTILDTCLRAGAPLPYNCRSGECGECMARLVAGQIAEMPGADPAVYDDADRAAGRILTCLCFPRSDIAIEIALRDGAAAAAVETVEATVERVAWLAPEIAEVTLTPERPVGYRAGQYFEWGLPGIAPDRAFSAANRADGRTIVFNVRIYPDGAVSRHVKTRMEAGDRLTLTGPFGSFGFSQNDYRPAICIAGGTGLAPIQAMLDDAFHKGDGRAITFFYGARTREMLYAVDTMTRWAGAQANFNYVPVLSDEPAGSDWHGERGLVTEAVARLITDPFGAEAYLCGPPPMIDAAIALLTELGLAADDIRYDKFTPAKTW
jgi:NAD(P)H-flavin reductase/ferredoxin